MADWCAVELPDERGELQQVALAHVDPERVEQGAELRERWPPGPRRADREPRGAAHRRGAAVPRGHGRDAGGRRATRSTWRRIRELGLSSAMVVPMIAGGRTLGVMSFVVRRERRRYAERRPRVRAGAGRPRGDRGRERAPLHGALGPPRRRCRRACCRSGSRPCPAGAPPPTTAPGQRGADVGGDFYDVFPVEDGAVVDARRRHRQGRRGGRADVARAPHGADGRARSTRARRRCSRWSTARCASGRGSRRSRWSAALLRGARAHARGRRPSAPAAQARRRPSRRWARPGMLLGAVHDYEAAADVTVPLAPATRCCSTPTA